MASAGRILIIPKGNYNAETKYEKLDLVFHSGASWLAKKDAVGIEPSDANAEYWFKMCEGSNTTELEQRIAAIENQLLSVANLDDIDLSAYATKAEVNAVSDAVDTLEINVDELGETVEGLSSEVDGFKTLLQNSDVSSCKVQILSYVGKGILGAPANCCSVTADFPVKVLLYVGYQNGGSVIQESQTSDGYIYSRTTILCDFLTTEFQGGKGFMAVNKSEGLPGRYAKKSEDGKTIYWYIDSTSSDPVVQLNKSNATYYFIALG